MAQHFAPVAKCKSFNGNGKAKCLFIFCIVFNKRLNNINTNVAHRITSESYIKKMILKDCIIFLLFSRLNYGSKELFFVVSNKI